MDPLLPRWPLLPCCFPICCTQADRNCSFPYCQQGPAGCVTFPWCRGAAEPPEPPFGVCGHGHPAFNSVICAALRGLSASLIGQLLLGVSKSPTKIWCYLTRGCELLVQSRADCSNFQGSALPADSLSSEGCWDPQQHKKGKGWHLLLSQALTLLGQFVSASFGS